MREHKGAIERQMAEKNENGKRDIVCEVRPIKTRRHSSFQYFFLCPLMFGTLFLSL